MSISHKNQPMGFERYDASGATGGAAMTHDALSRLHHDESGAISIVSVFSMMLLAMLLGMLINVGRQVDGKVKMQNAADSATYSGGVVLARGMNTLAFTNHLLCDIFATTAILREAQQRNAAGLTPEILAAWGQIGPVLSQSSFPKFAAVGPAILQKVPLEQQMVTSFSNWIGAVSNLVLPTWEQILAQELIPTFQRALVQATPRLAQLAANDITRRHGLGSPERGVMQAALWRTSGVAVGAEADAMTRTLPVVDPELDSLPNQQQYFADARRQRDRIAHAYLRQWNDHMMAAFDQIAKMSQFGNLWRGFTCGQLDKLLNHDYPNNNLPFQLRSYPDQPQDNTYLERDYHFIGVAYWPRINEALPGLFHETNNTSDQTYAEMLLFVPRNRLVWANVSSTTNNNPGLSIGGVPGGLENLPGTGSGGGLNTPNPPATWQVVRENKDTHWGLMNQSWTVKLAPAVSPSLITILETTPPQYAGNAKQPQVPSLRSVSNQDWQILNNH